ncbi:MAG: hypothetical protein LBL91_05410 [Lachnospiraceae bacterium]|jgi:hypothetical protein|nr:hypothetical protein [Lachnospiraceae bacterium]
MNKNLVTEFSTEWIKYSDYTTKRTNGYSDEYIMPAKNAKPIKYTIADVADEMIIDYLNIGKKFEFERFNVKNAILDFAKKYGLIGIISYLPLNTEYTYSDKVYLSGNDIGMLKEWDLIDYLKQFFPFEFKKKFKATKPEKKFPRLHFPSLSISMIQEETTDSDVFWGANPEFSLPFSKYYAEKIDDIGAIANAVYNKFKASYDYDFNTPYQERSFKGFDFFKARNITINAKAGESNFSLQWAFNSLALALDTILLVKICDTNQPLRMCKFCNQFFIAENVRAEYCSPQCRNKANVYKSREKYREGI